MKKLNFPLIITIFFSDSETDEIVEERDDLENISCHKSDEESSSATKENLKTLDVENESDEENEIVESKVTTLKEVTLLSK